MREKAREKGEGKRGIDKDKINYEGEGKTEEEGK